MEPNQISDPSATLITSEHVSNRLANTWLAQHPRWFADLGQPLEVAPNKTELRRFECELGSVLVKRDVPSARKAALERLGMRRPRARRAFEHAQMLASSGLALPAAHGWLTATNPTHRSFFLREYVEGDTLTERLVKTPVADELLAEVGRVIAHLHKKGWRHRDLKAPNLLVQAGTEAPRVLVVDLDGLWRPGWQVSGRGRRRDLGRLCVSFRVAGQPESSWRRLVEHYLTALSMRGGGVDQQRLDRLTADTERWADAKRRRNERRGLPLA